MSNAGIGVGTIALGAGADLSGLYQSLGLKSLPNGYPSLDSSGLVPLSELPEEELAASVFEAADESEQLAFVVRKGDFCNRSDQNQTYIALNSDNNSMSDWTLLLAPAGAVISVDGQAGVVDLSGDYAPIDHGHAADDITENVDKNFVSQTQIGDWDAKPDANEVVTLTGNQSVDGDKTFNDNLIATTQSQGDDSTKVATTEYVDTGLEDAQGALTFQAPLDLTADVVSLPQVSAFTDGYITIGEHQKLAGVAFFANNYVLPASIVSWTIGQINISENKIAHVANNQTLLISLSEALDQSFLNTPNIYGGGGAWQSFTAQYDYLTGVEVFISGNKSNITFKIYEGEGTGGNLLLTKTPLNFSSGANRIDFDPIRTIPGTKYTMDMVIVATNISWYYNIAGGYAGGRADFNPSADFYFKTYGINSYVLISDAGVTLGGEVKLSDVKSGATQGAAGAALNELWKTNTHATLPDNVMMIGV